MGMFGNSITDRFKITLPEGATPPIAPVQQPQVDPTVRKPDSLLHRILGGLADGIAQQTGGQAAYIPQLARRQQDAQIMARQATQQQNEFQRQIDLYNYKLAHPAPVSNDTINDFNWYKGLSDADKAVYDQMHPVYKVGPDGLTYPISRSSIGATATTQTIGATLPQGWTVDGGPTPPASGGFRK